MEYLVSECMVLLVQVRTWQEDHRNMAKTKGYVCTMLGRRRQLPEAANNRNRARQGHALRAAINTPIQVSHPSPRHFCVAETEVQ